MNKRERERKEGAWPVVDVEEKTGGGKGRASERGHGGCPLSVFPDALPSPIGSSAYVLLPGMAKTVRNLRSDSFCSITDFPYPVLIFFFLENSKMPFTYVIGIQTAPLSYLTVITHESYLQNTWRKTRKRGNHFPNGFNSNTSSVIVHFPHGYSEY